MGESLYLFLKQYFNAMFRRTQNPFCSSFKANIQPSRVKSQEKIDKTRQNFLSFCSVVSILVLLVIYNRTEEDA